MENHEKLPPFLRKTWDIVEDPSTDDVVKWSLSGRSFVVQDVELFSKAILPRFFKHSNWSSFVRQLNTYGFRKIDPDRWEFANESFSKGGKGLLNMIQRRKPTLTTPGQGQMPDQPCSVQHLQSPTAQPIGAGAEYRGSHMVAEYAPQYDMRSSGMQMFYPDQARAMDTSNGAAVTAEGCGAVHHAGVDNDLLPQTYIIATEPPAVHAPVQKQHSTNDLHSGSGGSGAGMERVTALVQDYLRPGQKILANIGMDTAEDVVQDSHSTCTTSGPSGSTENDDDEVHKMNKRTRGERNREGGGQPTKAVGSCSSGPDSADCGPYLAGAKDAAKDAAPLPLGVTRPTPHSLGMTTQSLITEMAGQIGRLSHLAGEVQGLKHDNAKLWQGMDAVLTRGGPGQESSGIHARLAEQQDAMWHFKLQNDELASGIQYQIAAQAKAQADHLERSTMLEAQLAQQCKLAFDSVELRNVSLVTQLARQEGINQLQLTNNKALEARVAELEQQLSGRQEEMLKGLEDRVMNTMAHLFSSTSSATRNQSRTVQVPSAAPASVASEPVTTPAIEDAATSRTGQTSPDRLAD